MKTEYEVRVLEIDKDELIRKLESLNATKVGEFNQKRYEVQLNAMQTGKNDEEKFKKVQDLYVELIEKPEAKQYFDAETKFNILIADVNKIIGDTIKDVME